MRRGVELSHALPGARDHGRPSGLADGVIYYDADGVEHRQRAESCAGLQRDRDAAAAAELALGAVSPTASPTAPAWSVAT